MSEHTHDHHDHHHGHSHGEGHSCSTVQNMEKFGVTDIIVRADIMAKAKELAGLISDTDEVQFYKRAEKQVQANSEVQELIKLIKKRQKEAVAFESFQNQKMVDKINGEIEELQDRLDAYPIVGQFKQSQEDINYLLQLVVNVIRDTVSENIQIDDAVAETSSNCSE